MRQISAYAVFQTIYIHIIHADQTFLLDLHMRSDPYMILDNGSGSDLAMITDLYVSSDHTERCNLHVRSDLHIRTDIASILLYQLCFREQLFIGFQQYTVQTFLHGCLQLNTGLMKSRQLYFFFSHKDAVTHFRIAVRNFCPHVDHAVALRYFRIGHAVQQSFSSYKLRECCPRKLAHLYLADLKHRILLPYPYS